jgi:tyrosine-specific transport protein
MLKKPTRLLGGILIIAGTTIGAGMLALPVTTAFGGFFPSLILFFICWLIMLATSFFFLDVNLFVKGEPNFISMSGKMLGLWGKTVSWVVYLLLLYSLTAAYITASGPFFIELVHYLTGWTIPAFLGPFCLPLLFGFFIYLGTQGVDYINRFLMLGLILAFLILISIIPTTIHPELLLHWDFPAIAIAIPTVFTSFGYHIVIPSLTTYFEHDKKQLRMAILIGSIIPLITYLLWQALVLGVVPVGDLAQIWKSGALVTEPLVKVLSYPWIAMVASFFSFFAVVTSFLGVALSLSDFLTDGFKLKKSWEGRLIAICLTFLPPLVFVFTYKRGFYIALQHAGALVAILLGILPAAMAWRLKKPSFYRTPLGRALLIAVLIVSFAVVVFDILENQGVLNMLSSAYVQ